MILTKLLDRRLLCCEVLRSKNLLGPPFITGSPVAVKVLTEDMKEITGGQVIIDGDAKSSADKLEQIILEKRKSLNI